MSTQRWEARPRRSLDAPLWRGVRCLLGIVFGFAVQLLFLLTVWKLFWFLRDGGVPNEVGSWVLRDFLLASLFAVAHSLMLVPASRRRLTRVVPGPFYDSLFCLVTCVSLLAMFACWGTSPTVLWQFNGAAETAIRIGFYGCWLALLYSLSLTGLGWQTGWTPFWHWLRGTLPPRRCFQPRGAYKLIRHPVYLSFLGLVWCTPRMTLDHAVLTAIWTAYIFYGSVLKDRRLQRFIGNPYRQYAQQVIGFPLMFLGPLGKLSRDSDTAPTQPPSARAEPQADRGSPAASHSKAAA